MNIIIKFNNITKIIEIKKNENYKTISNKIEEKLKPYVRYFSLNKYNIIFRNKIINKNNEDQLLKLKNNDILFIEMKLKGGLETIVNLLLTADEFFKKMLDIVNKLIEIFKLVFESIPLIFEPSKLIDDIISGVINGITAGINGVLNSFSFGSETNAKKEAEADNEKLGVFGVTDKSRAMCAPASFIDLIILVLCPPLALFMKKKMKFFFQVLLCCILTYKLYYFPGFIFAAVFILC